MSGALKVDDLRTIETWDTPLEFVRTNEVLPGSSGRQSDRIPLVRVRTEMRPSEAGEPERVVVLRLVWGRYLHYLSVHQGAGTAVPGADGAQGAALAGTYSGAHPIGAALIPYLIDRSETNDPKGQSGREAKFRYLLAKRTKDVKLNPGVISAPAEELLRVEDLYFDRILMRLRREVELESARGWSGYRVNWETFTYLGVSIPAGEPEIAEKGDGSGACARFAYRWVDVDVGRTRYRVSPTGVNLLFTAEVEKISGAQNAEQNGGEQNRGEKNADSVGGQNGSDQQHNYVYEVEELIEIPASELPEKLKDHLAENDVIADHVIHLLSSPHAPHRLLPTVIKGAQTGGTGP